MFEIMLSVENDVRIPLLDYTKLIGDLTLNLLGVHCLFFKVLSFRTPYDVRTTYRWYTSLFENCQIHSLLEHAGKSPAIESKHFKEKYKQFLYNEHVT